MGFSLGMFIFWIMRKIKKNFLNGFFHKQLCLYKILSPMHCFDSASLNFLTILVKTVEKLNSPEEGLSDNF